MTSKTTSDKKKLCEEAILKMVYPVDQFKEIKSTEEGGVDFLITRCNSTCFGVQITQLYSSESAARLKNIDHYKDTLLKTGKHLHKDDVNFLICDEIDICSSNGDKIKVQAIVEEMPNYQDKINHVISEKQEKLLTKVDAALIIYDKQQSLISLESFYRNFFLKPLAEAVIKSPFQEIYFITKIQNKFIYIPLKLAGILREAYLLNHTLQKMWCSIGDDFVEFELMCECLISLGIGTIRYTKQNNIFTLLLGDFDLKIDYSNPSMGTDLGIELHHGYSMHKNAEIYKTKPYLLDNISSEHSESRSNSPFLCSLAFDVV